MNEKSDDLEIEQEQNEPEIIAALIRSKQEVKRGEVGTEEDIFKILREKK